MKQQTINKSKEVNALVMRGAKVHAACKKVKLSPVSYYKVKTSGLLSEPKKAPAPVEAPAPKQRVQTLTERILFSSLSDSEKVELLQAAYRQ